MTGIPQGSEFAVNTITLGTQQTFFASSGTSHTPRAVAIDSDGDYIVTWTGQDGSLTGIHARRYNKDGVAQDAIEFGVNRTTAGRQAFSSVAMDADGDFVITWTSSQDDGLGISYGIYAQRYNSAGVAQDGEFLVNAPSFADQNESTIAIDSTGNFIITWTGNDAGGRGIFAQRYNSAGVAQGVEFRVNTETTGEQRASSVAMDADGDFVVTWTSNGQDGNLDGVYAQRYNNAGVAQGTEFRVNTTTLGNQQNASVSMDTTGNFVVAWSSDSQDGSGFGVYARIFDATGTPVSNEIQVNQFTTSDQRFPSVSVDDDGDFVVSWSSVAQPLDALSTGIVARRFNKVGTPQGGEFLVNTTVLGIQQYPSVAVDANGGFVVAWTSPDANGTGVFGQRFSPALNNSPIDLSLSNLTVVENVPAGTVVGTFTTLDPDLGDTTFTYTLIETGSFPDNNSFQIQIKDVNDNPPIFQLFLLFSPDRETQSSYTINVQTTDPGGFSYTETLTITVTDVNDTAPTDLTLTSTTVAENVVAGTPVGILNNNDPDTGNTFTYTLFDPIAFPDNAAFTIDAATRELRVVASPDFETKALYSIQVQVNDGAGGIYAEVFTISVTDVVETPPNQEPTDLGLTNSSVQENVPANTVIGSLTTADPNINDTFTYSLVSSATFPDNAAFTIDGGQLRIAVSPDFEARNSYSIRVRTTDQSGGFFEKSLTISVVDVDESNPGNGIPVIDLNGIPPGIDGNASGATGAPIQLVSANATLTDANSPNLNSALVIISNSFDAPNETLTANTSGTNITATYSTTGVLNLTGAASIATYLQVLRSVTYLNSAAIPNTTPRNVLFIVSDGQSNSQVATTTLTLDSVNSVMGTAGNDAGMVTTPITDVIDAIAGNDIVTSIAAYLKQQDTINGGDGIDTFVLQDGTGNLTVRVADSANQLPDLAAGTTISNFEVFDLSGFTGNVTMLGSATLNDHLIAGSGNDTLNGAAGDDTLVGNQGNDLYVMDSAGDRILEGLNAGTDTVETSINYTLGENLENLTLTGSASNGTGNSLNNVITGNARGNRLRGGEGNDTLLGGGKADKLLGGGGDDLLNGQRGKRDRLKGGQGNDSFVLSAARGFGADVIADFKPNDDTILFSRSGVVDSIALGTIADGQLVYGSAAQDGGDRFLYNLQSGALLFDRDGTGSATAVLIGTLKNKPRITAADIVVI